MTDCRQARRHGATTCGAVALIGALLVGCAGETTKPNRIQRMVLEPRARTQKRGVMT